VHLRKEMEEYGLVKRFTMRTGQNVCIVTVRTIKAKRSVEVTRTYTENRRAIDQTQETEEVQFLDAFQIVVR